MDKEAIDRLNKSIKEVQLINKKALAAAKESIDKIEDPAKREQMRALYNKALKGETTAEEIKKAAYGS